MNIYTSHYQLRQGFTLLELLTVVVIIGILSAIAFASVTRMRATAHEVRCVSNLRSLGMAGLAYANDNAGMMPDVLLWRSRDLKREKNKRYSILPYLYGDGEINADREYGNQSILACPLAQNDTNFSVKGAEDTATYAINVYAHGTNIDKAGMGNYDSWLLQNRLTGNLYGFENPQKVPFFMDGSCTNDGYGRRYSGFQQPNRTNKPIGGATSGWTTPYLHRNDSVAIVFIDGSVKHVDQNWLKDPENWLGN